MTVTGRYDRPEKVKPDTKSIYEALEELPDIDVMPPLVVRQDKPGQPPTTIQHAFERFDRANPWVAIELRKMSLDLVHKGHTKIGMKMLFEVLRWRVMRSTKDTSSSFKLNNNYTACYSRMLMESEPALEGVFDTRVRRTP